jgi:hypothetical protein
VHPRAREFLRAADVDELALPFTCASTCFWKTRTGASFRSGALYFVGVIVDASFVNGVLPSST